MKFGRYLLLNTVHLRCRTGETLNQWARLPATRRPIPVAATDFGWFVPTTPLSAQLAAQIPTDLFAVLAFGRGHGCDYVLFDSDGPTEPALPRYPW